MKNELANAFLAANPQIRTATDVQGNLWIVATDVAKAVGYSDTGYAVRRYMPKRKKLGEVIQTAVHNSIH